MSVMPDVSDPKIDAATVGGGPIPHTMETRLLAVVAAARHHGVDLNADDYRPRNGEQMPSPASLAAWARDQGLHARTDKLRWKALFPAHRHQ